MLAQGVAALTFKCNGTCQHGAYTAVRLSLNPSHWFLCNAVLPHQTPQRNYEKWFSEIQSPRASSECTSKPDCLWMAWSVCVLTCPVAQGWGSVYFVQIEQILNWTPPYERKKNCTLAQCARVFWNTLSGVIVFHCELWSPELPGDPVSNSI